MPISYCVGFFARRVGIPTKNQKERGRRIISYEQTMIDFTLFAGAASSNDELATRTPIDCASKWLAKYL